MKFLNLFIIMFAVFTITTGSARAASGGRSGWSIPVAVMYLVDNQKNGSTTTNTSRLLANASLGYTFGSAPIFLGASYEYDDITSNTTSAQRTVSGYGGTVGVVTDHVYLKATYIASADYKTAVTTTSYKEGTGFMARLGYMFDASSNFQVGPELSYRSIKWTKTGTGATADFQYDTVLPYVVFKYSF